MKKQIILCMLLLISFSIAAQNLAWVKGIGGSGLDEGRDVARDAAGNVYLTGYFSATVDFNPGTAVFNLTAVGSWDGYVMKLDALGNFIWAKQFGGTSEEFFENIAVDNSGNVIVGGHFNGTTDFNPGAAIFNLSTNGGEDVFILKLDASGNFIWAKKVGGANADYNEAIAVDASGNICAVGSFTFLVDFDPGAGVFNLNWSNAAGYMLKLDANGNFLWAYGIRANCDDVHIDANGNIYNTGSFGGTTDFDPGAGVFNLTSAYQDMFITKFNAAGSFIWAKNMGGNLSTEGHAVCTDANGNVYTTGRFEGTVDFNPGAATNMVTSNGEWDVFISKLDAAGNFVWVNKIGGINWEYAFDIDVDANANVYVAGAFQDVVDFDPGAGNTSFLSMSLVNAYNLKLNSAGNFLWVVPFSSFDQIYTYANAANDDGSCYVAGDFSSSTDFDPAAGFQFVSPVGGADSYLCKLSSCTQLPNTGNISGNSTLCSNTTTTYSIASVTGATGYTWTVPSGAAINSGQNTNSINVTLGSSSGNVSVTPFSACGNGTLSTLNIIVTQLPNASSISANGNTTFCAGGSVILSGNVGGTWSTGATTNAINVFNPGNYFVTNSNSCGNVNSNQIIVTVNSAPTASTISANGNTTFCAGSSVTLIGNAGGVWSNGATSSSINASVSGNYFVTNSNSCGSVNSNQIIVTVNPLPNPSAISANGNTTFCVGGSVILSGNAGGTWSTGATTNTITVINPGNYFVTNTNSCGSVNSNQITVTVNQAPLASTISSNGNNTFCAGGSVTLSGNAGGIWSNGATSSTINVNASGNYFVTNSNSCGTVNSNQIIVTVNPLPNPSAISANGNTTFCAGGSVTLTGNAGGTWNNGATTPTINVTSSAIYYVTNTNACGSVFSNQINVIVNPLPTASVISANGNTTFCAGSSVTLIGNAGGTWSTGASSSTINASTGGNYFVTNTNSCGSVNSNQIIVTVNPLPSASTISANGNTTFCAGASVTLSGNAGGTWNTGATTPTIVATNSGNYFVTNTNSCGSLNSNQIIVTVNPLPIPASISAGGVTTFCTGNFVILFGNTGGTWSNGATTSSINVTSSGDYYVTTTNLCGNSTSNIIQVAVENLPVASNIQATSATQFCAGDSVLLIGNAGGNWNTGSDSSSITAISSGDYYVTTINSCGTTSSNQITVNVWPAPTTPAITQLGNNLETTFGYASYQWYENGNPISNLDTNIITPSSSGDFVVEVIDSNGCAASSAVFNYVLVGLENNVHNGLQFYPNPTFNLLTIELNKLENNAQFEIINLAGELVLGGALNNKKTILNLTFLSNGLYFIKLYANNEILQNKFIKQ